MLLVEGQAPQGGGGCAPGGGVGFAIPAGRGGVAETLARLVEEKGREAERARDQAEAWRLAVIEYARLCLACLFVVGWERRGTGWALPVGGVVLAAWWITKKAMARVEIWENPPVGGGWPGGGQGGCEAGRHGPPGRGGGRKCQGKKRWSVWTIGGGGNCIWSREKCRGKCGG